MRRWHTLLSLALIIYAVSAFAQGGGNVAITGTVTDPSGAVLAGAKVMVTQKNTSVTRVDTTNGAGQFNVSPIPPATYTVIVDDPRQHAFETGPATFDHRHHGVVSFVWNLPRLRSSNGLVRNVLGGWQWTGISSITTGSSGVSSSTCSITPSGRIPTPTSPTAPLVPLAPLSARRPATSAQPPITASSSSR